MIIKRRENGGKENDHYHGSNKAIAACSINVHSTAFSTIENER